MHERRPPEQVRTHRLPVRVYYEDTDAAGLVYHARYLHFMERARTEMLRAAGGDHPKLMAEEGLAFAVRRLAIEFVRPARLDDLLAVETVMTGFTGARIELSQRVLREGAAIAECTLTLVCLDRSGRARRIPAQLLAAFADGPHAKPTEGA
jgi:acyl-CoA thioester hydrolase